MILRSTRASNRHAANMYHPDQYFGRLYCISLDRRPDRWRCVESRFRRWGLSVERLAAVDGWQTARNRTARAAEPVNSLSAGELGCLLSHRKTIEEAQRGGFERILVLEDDVYFHRRFLERFQEIATVSDDWNLLYLGCSQYDRSRLEAVNEHFYRARKTLGTFAYGIHRRWFQKFLDATRSLSAPADVVLCRLQEETGGKCLVWQPPLVIADVRDSDIRPARDLKRHAARLQWPLEDYEMPVPEFQDSPNLIASGFHALAACRFRLPSKSHGLAQCRHPQVRTSGGLVSPAACESCGIRQSANEGLGNGALALVKPIRAIPSPKAEATDSPPSSPAAVEPEANRGRFAEQIRPRVILAIDRFGWAFHSDAEGLLKHLSDEFSFTIVPHRDLARRPELVEGDLLVAFWWQSLLGIDTSRVGAVVCGLFDTWSWDIHGVRQLQAAFDKATALLVSNSYILDDLRNHPAGLRPPASFVCEEGVDCEIFRPQPFPHEFCVGWAGTTANARSYRGAADGKGLGMIQQAARDAGVRLVTADREDVPGVYETRRQIAHERMPEEFYRHISAHCIGSYSEGAPLTAAEALACGRPVISTNVGIVSQVVQHGVNGLIAPRDAASLAAAMQEMKRLGPENLSASARRSALLMDWSRQAPKWAHCFRAALELGSRRTHARIAPRPEFASGEWQVSRHDSCETAAR